MHHPRKRTKPTYFEAVRREAAGHWKQLRADPELAGPWHQLFRQLRTDPRFVLSELLQNADDVGATWARATLAGELFRFEHNGQDFTEADFRSLCRFAFSNKRLLHTIGFRGIGFKTTFSLGPSVDILTPTLAVRFDETQFTEPIWLPDADPTPTTVIQIVVKSPERQRALADNLQSWKASPLPLLFFRSLRELEIQDSRIACQDVPGARPAGARRFDLGPGRDVWLISSTPDPFPEETLAEIREERRVDEFDLPPSEVQLVLNAGGAQRLYSVLPTGVELRLPFSCNAPFVQDPARTGIKSPSVSATNRWLLGRIGRLAADALEEWLAAPDIDLASRARAYQWLLPEHSENQRRTLAEECTELVVDAFRRRIAGRPVLLATTGKLCPPKECNDIPVPLLQVWTAEQNAGLFGDAQLPVLAGEVGEGSRERLARWGWLRRSGSSSILQRLQVGEHPPHPGDQPKLIQLWDYVQESIADQYWYPAAALRILPVKGQDKLFSTTEVTVIGGASDHLTPADWEFLARYARVVEPEWLRSLKEVEGHASQQSDRVSDRRLAKTVSLLNRLEIDGRGDVDVAFGMAAIEMFQQSFDPSDAKRLTYLAARADVRPADGFAFMCSDGKWRLVTSGLVVDKGDACSYLPKEWTNSHLIHPCYSAPTDQRDYEAWRSWAGTLKSRLERFPLPDAKTWTSQSRRDIEQMIRRRGGSVPSEYPKVREKYRIADYDFPYELQRAWRSGAERDEKLWANVVLAICQSWSERWALRANAQIQQEGNKELYPIDHGFLVAKWICDLRGTRCLPDQHGRLCQPAELCRTTPDTAHLQGIESFLHPDYDRPAHISFLDLLGVRSKPGSFERIVERIRALGKADKPPIANLYSLYRALDRTCTYLTQEIRDRLRTIFRNERLIWGSDGHWHKSSEIFQDNPDQVADIPLIPDELDDLRLWEFLWVPAQPSLEHMIAWAKALPSGEKVRDADVRRLRGLLARAAAQVYDETEHWLDLDGRWTPVRDLKWSATSNSAAESLFPHIRRSTAFLAMLTPEARRQPPFGSLKPLEPMLQNRVRRVLPKGSPDQPPWLRSLAEHLLRFLRVPDDTTDATAATASFRSHARLLCRTRRQLVSELAVTPYLEGEPAGPERVPEVLWDDETLYVRRDGAAGYEKLVEALTGKFEDESVRRAIRTCVQRDCGWIADYFSEHFELAPAEELDRLMIAEGAPNWVPTRFDSKSASEVPPAEEGVNPLEVSPDISSSLGDPDKPNVQFATPAQAAPTRVARSIAHDPIGTFFTAKGCRYDHSSELYRHRDGWVVRKVADVYPWQMENGWVVRCYWVGQASLADGVEVPAEVWSLLRDSPEHYALLLPEPGGALREHLGNELLDALASRQIELFSASYRLRTVSDSNNLE